MGKDNQESRDRQSDANRRFERLAGKLKENLKKRKGQAQARAGTTASKPAVSATDDSER